ncbi:MAG: hypothetical protein OXN21_10980 [Chloroflexota bacterium]|nr:hypothetical protein [Chloroflexota bacterium]
MDKDYLSTQRSLRSRLPFRNKRPPTRLLQVLTVPVILLSVLSLAGFLMLLFISNVHFIEGPDEARARKYEHLETHNRPSFIHYGPYASWALDGTKLTFQYNNSIYSINSDGTDLKRISANGENKEREYAIQPNMSPDGKHVAYTWYKKKSRTPWAFERSWQIVVQPMDGGKYQQVTTPVEGLGTQYFHPVFSPDGNDLAYIRQDHEGSTRRATIVIINVETGTSREALTIKGSDMTALQWSPDGNHLSYMIFQGIYNGRLFTLPAAGGIPREVAVTAAKPGWTPDGKYLTFIKGSFDWEPFFGTGELPLAWVTPDGDHETVTLQDMRDHGFLSERHRNALAWSKDGTKLLAMGEDNTLIMVSQDGSKARRVTKTEAMKFEIEASWAPDSERIAIVSVPSRTELREAPYGSPILIIANTTTSDSRVLARFNQEGRNDQKLEGTTGKDAMETHVRISWEWPSGGMQTDIESSVPPGDKVSKSLGMSLDGHMGTSYVIDQSPEQEPCSSEGDTCNPRDISQISPTMLGAVEASSQGGDVPTVEEMLESGFLLARASPTHVAAIGRISSDSIRCDWTSITLTSQQREANIRFWMNVVVSQARNRGVKVETVRGELVEPPVEGPLTSSGRTNSSLSLQA